MKRSWNPYLAGALAGLLLVLSVAVAGQYFGASTTFARGAAAIEQTAGVDTSRYEYFTTKGGKYGPDSLPNWQLLFVVGIALGGLGASLATGTFEIKRVPDMWAARFGDRDAADHCRPRHAGYRPARPDAGPDGRHARAEDRTSESRRKLRLGAEPDRCDAACAALPPGRRFRCSGQAQSWRAARLR